MAATDSGPGPDPDPDDPPGTTTEEEGKYSDEQLLAAVRSVAAQLGHSPTGAEFSIYGDAALRTITARFGTWNAAKHLAGLETDPRGSKTTIADDGTVETPDGAYEPTPREEPAAEPSSRLVSSGDELPLGPADSVTSLTRPVVADLPADEIHMPTPQTRQLSTFELFERYWVMGQSAARIAEETGVQVGDVPQRGITTRSTPDAQRLRYGRVTLEELWPHYLTMFEYELAVELRSLRTDELGMADEPGPTD